jgi:hypothetical protein
MWCAQEIREVHTKFCQRNLQGETVGRQDVDGRVILKLMFCEYSSETLISKKYRVFLADELLTCQEGLIPMQKVKSR